MGRCKKCNHPRKGHAGPLGSKCTNEWTELTAEEILDDSLSEDENDDPNYEDESKKGAFGGPREKPSWGDAFTMKEMMKQLTMISADLQKFSDDNRDLATSHIQMQKRLEYMASSDGAGGAGKTVDILAALAAIGAPALAEQPVSMFNGARVNKKVVAAAKNREFINLTDFVPNTEPNSNLVSVMDEKTGSLVFKTKNSRRSIDNFLMWSTAWCAYESLIMETDPTMYAICTNYRLFVQRKEALHTWSAVSTYDIRHRIKLSITKSWSFDTADSELHMDVFSSETLRPNPKSCFRCKSLDHMVKDCFLPEDVSSSKSSQGSRKFSKNSDSSFSQFNSQVQTAMPVNGVYNPSNQVCRDFNLGRCTRNPCVRKHVCTGCGGPQPLFRCARCQSNTAGNTFGSTSSGLGTAFVSPS
jgi:hypothetical protein